MKSILCIYVKIFLSIIGATVYCITKGYYRLMKRVAKGGLVSSGAFWNLMNISLPLDCYLKVCLSARVVNVIILYNIIIILDSLRIQHNKTTK